MTIEFTDNEVIVREMSEHLLQIAIAYAEGKLSDLLIEQWETGKADEELSELIDEARYWIMLYTNEIKRRKNEAH